MLRPLTRADAPTVARFAADFDVAKMTTRMPHPYGLSDAEAFIDSVAGPPDDDQAVFGVTHKDDGLVGAIGFHACEDGHPELGYWIGKPYWGRGFATEAAREALAWARDAWGRRIVFAGHFADNPASGAVLIKSGFLYTGDVVKARSVARGEDADLRKMVWLA